MSFEINSKFARTNNQSQVIFGEGRSLLETELNELQQIQNDKRKQIIEELFQDGFTEVPAITFTGGNLTLTGGKVLIGGEILTITTLRKAAVNNDKLFLVTWEQVLRDGDSTYLNGNVQATPTPIALIDPRASVETTRRVQLQFNLVKESEIAGRKSFPIGQIVLGTFIPSYKVVAPSGTVMDGGILPEVTTFDAGRLEDELVDYQIDGGRLEDTRITETLDGGRL